MEMTVFFPRSARNSSKLTRGLIVGASIFIASTAAAQTPCALSVGWEPWFPYAYTDAHLQLTGLDIELVQRLGEKSGCAIKFVSRPWSRLLKEISSGEEAMAMGATRTAEREAYAYFTRPYRTERLGVLIQTGKLPSLKAKSLMDLIQLPGGKIGTVTDWEYGLEYAVLKKSPQFADWVELAARDDINLRRLEAGRLKAMLMDLVSARLLVQDLRMERAVEFHPLIVSQTDIHFMLSKASVPLETFKRLDAAVEDLKNSPEAHAIYRKYADQ